MITRDRTIIDGYCRWELARRQGRATTVTCIEYDLSEEEALSWLLYKWKVSTHSAEYFWRWTLSRGSENMRE